MTLDDDVPPPELHGDVTPPARQTPIPGDTQAAEPRPPMVVGADIPHLPALLELLGQALTMAFDALDAAGDAVAERLGIRPAAGEPPASSPPPI